MKLTELGCVVLVVVAVIAVPTPTSAEDCPAFLLKNDEGKIGIERIDVRSGQVNVWKASAESGLIDLILPVGGGVSGSMASTGDGRLHVVRCTGEEIHHEVRMEDGKKYEAPVRTLEDLRRYNIRVSVTGGAGERRAFLVSRYDRVSTDSGPVQNLLAGQPIPLGHDDYFLTTDTYPSEAGPDTKGEFGVELKGYPFVRGHGEDGTEGWFLVDTGGGQTLIERSFLSPDTVIDESKMVQYSSEGRRVLDYQPGGATGQVKGILGHAQIANIRFGDVEFQDVRAAIIEDMPDLFDRPVVGILGLDQLSRAERLILEFPSGASGDGVFRLADGDALPQSGETVSVVPFSILRNHLVVPLSINGVLAHFILDTGAPDPLLDVETARAAGIEETPQTSADARGLDGGKIARSSGVAERFSVGEQDFESVDCMIAALPVFNSLRAPDQRLGLLGNSFFGRFARVEIDFVGNRVFFVQ